MKKSSFKAKIRKNICENKRKYMLIFSLYALGIIVGGVSVFSGNQDNIASINGYFDSFISVYPIQGISKYEVFKESFFNLLQIAGFIWISGWHIALLPIGLVQALIKGYKIGYTFSYLCISKGIKGITFAVIALLPQNIILISGLCLFISYQMRFALDRRNSVTLKYNRELKKQVYINNLIMTMIFMLIIIITAFVEGYITTSLIKMMVPIMKT